MYRRPARHKPDLLTVLVLAVSLGVAASIGYQIHARFHADDMASVKVPAPYHHGVGG